jgi:hypothetical protein
MPTVKCSIPEFKSGLHNKDHDTPSGIPIFWHQRVTPTMGHTLVGQTLDPCVPFAVVCCAKSSTYLCYTRCRMVQGQFCYILSLPFTITGIHLNCDLACYFWFAGESRNFSSKFFLGMRFLNLVPAGWAYSQCSCTGVLNVSIGISELCTSCLQCHARFLSSVLPRGTKHKHHSQLSRVHSQSVLCTSV